MRNAEFGIIYIPLIRSKNRRGGFYIRTLRKTIFRLNFSYRYNKTADCVKGMTFYTVGGFCYSQYFVVI